MKTKLPSKITTEEESNKFLTELHLNEELYHPDDDAHDIVWAYTTASPKECDTLNSLMEQIYGLGLDPCEFIMDTLKP